MRNKTLYVKVDRPELCDHPGLTPARKEACLKGGRIYQKLLEGWQPGLGAGPPERSPLAIDNGKPCPMGAVVVGLAARQADMDLAIQRLDRCRAANCGLMLQHKQTGHLVCTGRGRSCYWLTNWVDFLRGSQICPHWKPAGKRANLS